MLRRLAVALTAIVALSCSSGTETAERPPATRPHDTTPTSLVPPVPSAPPPTGTPEDAAALAFEVLELSEEEKNCVIDAVAADPALHGALEAEPNKDSDAGRNLIAIAQACQRSHSLADDFADAAQRQADGSLTDDQIQCLTEAFAALTGDETQDLYTDALTGTDTDALADIYQSCDIPL